MSTAQTAVAATAIFVTAVIGIVAGHYVGTLRAAEGLHGPVAEVIAFPFVLLALVGAVVLGVMAHRRRGRVSRQARTIALVPVWLLAALLLLWIAANLAPAGG